MNSHLQVAAKKNTSPGLAETISVVLPCAEERQNAPLAALRTRGA